MSVVPRGMKKGVQKIALTLLLTVLAAAVLACDADAPSASPSADRAGTATAPKPTISAPGETSVKTDRNRLSWGGLPACEDCTSLATS